MTTIGIVGAGAAAAAATFAIENVTPNADVTVFEKSGGLCGRAATRRHDDLVYDYGANYVKSANDRVTELLTETLATDGLVDVTEPVYTFDESGSVSPGRDVDEHKWSYESGLTQIAKRLFGRTDATIHRRTRIETIARDDDRWTLTDADGDTWGPFETLLLNPPAPQTADLLADADWDDVRRSELQAAASAVSYRTIWTAVLRYPFRLDRPYYGLVNTDKNHPVGWISREECKGGHVPDDESLLIVQANDEWSRANYDRNPEANVTELAGHTADIVGKSRLSEPSWTDHQGWRYALPGAAADRETLAAAETAGLYCLGDWVVGEGRLHAALANGLDVGERVGNERR
jgi:predicted NAD/FAD-dependent oxidoreductase